MISRVDLLKALLQGQEEGLIWVSCPVPALVIHV